MPGRGRGGNWNRAGRRSGGDRPVRVAIGARATGDGPPSIQCFEQRHAECDGKLSFGFPGACCCACHAAPPNTEQVSDR